jgi:uncharacterized membrane protein YfcA
VELNALTLALVAAAALGGSLVNSIAGGGTLLTFPALLAIGIPPLVANATSTVALWPGSLASIWGYRSELAGARSWAVRFAIPSILGGFAGAWLLLRTPAERFEQIVPWLILGATGLFAAQGTLMRLVRRRPHEPSATVPPPPPSILFWQFLVGVYGGYFGAGIGIMMLAALGLMGLTNIHQMNGLKNWGGMCANLTAAVTFGVSGIVSWPVALTMAAGAIVGGYVGARLAQRVSQTVVRRLITAIGVCAGMVLLLQQRVTP